jgi:hypothetical protein
MMLFNAAECIEIAPNNQLTPKTKGHLRVLCLTIIRGCSPKSPRQLASVLKMAHPQASAKMLFMLLTIMLGINGAAVQV